MISPTKDRLLLKDRLKALCLEVCRQWELYAPLEDFGGEVQFIRVDKQGQEQALDRLNLDYVTLVIPPKTVAFPQLETLFEFEQEKIYPTVKPSTKKLLFGLRACDARGILFLDEFFKRNFEDIYYLSRSREKLLVIVGCKLPSENCFCTSTGTGPFLEEGFDLQLVDMEDRYLVEVGSPKAEEFVCRYSNFFAVANPRDIQRKKQLKQAAEEAVSLKLDFPRAIERFCADKVPRQIYTRIAERCIYCGGCVYVCPTCSCFNVFDEGRQNRGRRCRNWDACVFAGYTRQASGHNPRAEKWRRTARRYEHKLKYDYLTTGRTSCVGCGRCLVSCPVNIGIAQVIAEVNKL